MPALITRFAPFERAQLDETGRTVPVSLSSETPVKRGDVVEVLSHAPGAVDLSRAADGLPALFGHDHAAPIGIFENVRLERGRLVAVLRFGTSEKASEVLADVKAGILKYVSVSYTVDSTEQNADGYTVTRWTPYEGSVVSVPADPSVGIGRASSSSPSSESPVMPTTTTQAAPATTNRAEQDAEIRSLCQRERIAERAEGFIRAGLSPAQVGLQILNERAIADEASGGHLNVGSSDYFANRHPGSAGAVSRSGMVESLVARMGGRADAQRAAPYQHARLVDLARECLEERGVRTASMAPAALVERALHATSDFPELLQGAGNRVLRQAYEAFPSGIRSICRQSTARDFRAKSLLILGDFPTLEKVNEAGEFKHGTMAEGKSSYALSTYGKIFGITRQAIINDDLDALGQMAAYIGRAAATFEANFLAGLLIGNPAMQDGTALFHADHGNLSTGAGSALSQAALSEARRKMRLQTGLDGKTILDVAPRYLVVPAALESTGQQLIAQITPNSVATVNEFAGRLELVVDPRLDAVSPVSWYLAADAQMIDTIEYSYLDSANGPEVIMKEGFEIDGVQFKARLDFGAGIIDHRGLFKATGV